METPFKMKGFSGFGNNSPLKQDKLTQAQKDSTYATYKKPHQSFNVKHRTIDEGGRKPNKGGTSKGVKQVFIDYAKKFKELF